ncbi:uncharacterized protein PV07_01776 [Cladophialophora immunda]|uniref:Major facilitator superfamily (MFS) profile domain-containing protein n=1 Tax=Cladophialophora immunda TaxID=569365 RepID=A0A0D2CYS2_9EURO|nr:uncharacterized protein PV07_01776 [Cladophialophora immunda]KIW35050.1 hypothetical protein PV07_01776 [Cladophialophora immunda]
MAFGTERHWSAWNFFICFMVSLGQIAFGYPASIIGVTLAQPSFLVYMGLLDVTQDPPVMTPGKATMLAEPHPAELTNKQGRIRRLVQCQG